MIEPIVDLIWKVLNSPLFLMASFMLLIWVINHIYLGQPLWKKHEGAIISAIKCAEKDVPDESANKSRLRFNAALRYVLDDYRDATGKQASARVITQLKEGIRITHDQLERSRTLG